MIDLMSVLSTTELWVVSEGLVLEHLYAIATASLCFAGFYNGVQLTHLVFLNCEGQYDSAARRGLFYYKLYCILEQ